MVDVSRQIDAVTRSVRTEQLDGVECRVQSLTQSYPSPIDDVWDATTSAERIARWFLPVEGDLQLGGRYQLIGNAGGTIESCAPPSRGAAGYRVTWEYGGGVSRVQVDLRAAGEDSTELTLTHVAPAGDLPPGFWEQYGPGATGVGWDQGLLGLALHLAGDGSIAPAEAEAWMLSDEGRSFARQAADAWSAVQIAAGDAPDAARRAADATYAFYTGQALPEG
jgi:hypothetical protein